MRYTTTASQRRANRKYKRTHRKRVERNARRSVTKRYITRDASPAELKQVGRWLKRAEKKEGMQR